MKTYKKNNDSDQDSRTNSILVHAIEENKGEITNDLVINVIKDNLDTELSQKKTLIRFIRPESLAHKRKEQ